MLGNIVFPALLSQIGKAGKTTIPSSPYVKLTNITFGTKG